MFFVFSEQGIFCQIRCYFYVIHLLYVSMYDRAKIHVLESGVRYISVS